MDKKIIILSLTSVPAIKPIGNKQIRKKIILDKKSSFDNFSRKLL
tara:strand:+ start:682 stop:816 length:135 start_codon:yes stop_codon:yes gene_type:complete